jgi:MYXO-CTERM domain-containing protein
MSIRSIVLAASGGLGLCASAFGAINPFTETFASSGANWSSAAAFTALNYPGTGGPDGSGYGSTPFTFTSGSNGNPIAIFRGNDTYNSSGSAFVGNWFSAGVTTMTFSVRHNAPFSLQFFSRYLAVNQFTGAAYSFPNALVPANTWTTLSVPINNFADAGWTPEGPPSILTSTFSNLGKIQIGVWGDANTASQNGPWTFDIDNVSVTPAPGAAALLGIAGLGAARRRRR